MSKIKKTGLLVILVSLMLIAFTIPVMADVLDDAIAGKLSIGQKITFGSHVGISYTWYYMGEGYFICTDGTWRIYSQMGGGIGTSILQTRFDASSNGWDVAELNKRLNDSTRSDFIDLGGIQSDSRVAYATIPSLADYEQLSNIEKGNGYAPAGFWLRSVDIGKSYNPLFVNSGGFVSSSSASTTTGGVRPAFRLKSEIKAGNGLTSADIKQLVKDAISESITISTIGTNASTAVTNASTAATNASNAKASADAAVNILNGASNGGKSLAATYDQAKAAADKTITIPSIDTAAIANAVANNSTIQNINANTSEARNAERKKAIKVMDGGTFKEVVYDELSGSPVDGVTGASISGITATIPKVGLGITVLEGTINGTGVKVAVFGSRGIIFNVIAKPTIATVATVTFN